MVCKKMKLLENWIFFFLCNLVLWNKNGFVITEMPDKGKSRNRLSEVFRNVPHYMNDALEELQLTEDALQTLNVIMSMVQLSMKKSSDSVNGYSTTDMGLIANVLKSKITHSRKNRLERILDIWKTKVLESPHFFIAKESENTASQGNKRKGDGIPLTLPYTFPTLPAFFNN